MHNEKEPSFLVKYKKEILIGTIALLMLIFIVQNSDEIEFQLIFIRVQISLIFLITLFFALGLLTMWIRYHYIIKEKNKTIKSLEEKLKNKNNPEEPPASKE